MLFFASFDYWLQRLTRRSVRVGNFMVKVMGWLVNFWPVSSAIMVCLLPLNLSRGMCTTQLPFLSDVVELSRCLPSWVLTTKAVDGGAMPDTIMSPLSGAIMVFWVGEVITGNTADGSGTSIVGEVDGTEVGRVGWSA